MDDANRKSRRGKKRGEDKVDYSRNVAAVPMVAIDDTTETRTTGDQAPSRRAPFFARRFCEVKEAAVVTLRNALVGSMLGVAEIWNCGGRGEPSKANM